MVCNSKLARPWYLYFPSNIFPDASIKLFLGNINILISRLWLKHVTFHDVGKVQSFEDLNRKILISPEEEEILLADHLWTPTATLPCVSSLLAHSADFGHAILHKKMS